MSSVFSVKRRDSTETPPPSRRENLSSVPEKTNVFTVKSPKLDEVRFQEEESNPLESENLERDIERSSARGLSRVAERMLGLPGDIQGFLKSILPKSLEGLGGISLPSSEDLKGMSEKATKGYTKAQSEFEEKTDEFLGDVGSMLLPGSRAYSLSRNIGIPIAGALAKEYSGDPAKLGTMFLLDLITHKRAQIPVTQHQGAFRQLWADITEPGLGGAQRYVTNLFDQARRSIANSPNPVNVQPMIKELRTLEQTFLSGGGRPSTEKALERINAILGRAKNGQLHPEEFMDARVAINEVIEQLGGWAWDQPPRIRQRAIRDLNKVKQSVIRAGEDYGRNYNPEFLELWGSANEAQTAISRSNLVSNQARKWLGNWAVSPIIKALFGVAAPTSGALAKGAAVTGAAIAAKPLYDAGKMIGRIAMSPTLSRFYTRAIEGAAQGIKSVFLSNVSKLDKKTKEEEKTREKRKKELVR